jgi:hypothetical protein
MCNKLYCIVCWYNYLFYSQMQFTFVQTYCSFSIFRNNKFRVGDVMLCYVMLCRVRAVALHSLLH